MTPASALRIHATLGLVLLLKASGTLAAESAHPNPCGSFKDIAAQLAGTYHEAPVNIGIAGTGALVVLFQSANGTTWTLVVVPPEPDHPACALAAGRNWGDAPPLPAPGKET